MEILMGSRVVDLFRRGYGISDGDNSSDNFSDSDPRSVSPQWDMILPSKISRSVP